MNKTPIKDTAILLAGPAGSGKSTYGERFVANNPGFSIVSPDLLRLELTGDISDQSKNHFIFSILLPIRIRGLRSQMKGLLLDATNTTRKNRRSLIEHIRDCGFTQIECHVVKVSLEECLRRNAARERVVPQDVIERQHAQWQEPALDEGFDKIVYIET